MSDKDLSDYVRAHLTSEATAFHAHAAELRCAYIQRGNRLEPNLEFRPSAALRAVTLQYGQAMSTLLDAVLDTELGNWDDAAAWRAARGTDEWQRRIARVILFNMRMNAVGTPCGDGEFHFIVRTLVDGSSEAGMRGCPDCAVKPGERHQDGCDVERCAECGHQRISCECASPSERRMPWTGMWPGHAECIEFGWYAKLLPGAGWVACVSTEPGAQPDLDRLYVEARWDKGAGRFVRRTEGGN